MHDSQNLDDFCFVCMQDLDVTGMAYLVPESDHEVEYLVCQDCFDKDESHYVWQRARLVSLSSTTNPVCSLDDVLREGERRGHSVFITSWVDHVRARPVVQFLSVRPTGVRFALLPHSMSVIEVDNTGEEFIGILVSGRKPQELFRVPVTERSEVEVVNLVQSFMISRS